MWRTLVSLTLGGLLCAACASSPEAPEASTSTQPEVVQVAGKAASATWSATKTAGVAVGEGAVHAWHGVTNGQERPSRNDDYGPAPDDYATLIKKHFTRHLRVKESSTFRFSRPERGYMNHGILQGGRIAWRGYLVAVEVGSGRRARPYVVRLRDNEVIDVHKGATHPFLNRVPD